MPANDGTSLTWYSVLYPEGEQLRIETQALAYDHHTAIQAMQIAGLDNGYAACLKSGHWPSMDVLPSHETQQQGKPLLPFTTLFSAI